MDCGSTRARRPRSPWRYHLYGTFDAYLHRGLVLTDADIAVGLFALSVIRSLSGAVRTLSEGIFAEIAAFLLNAGETF
jgi:hypothetical protein